MTAAFSGWLLGFCVLSLLTQAWLLTTSFYNQIWLLLVAN